jgi:hypothetical protein
MNAEMIVKALKHCAKHNCEGCPYNGPSNWQWRGPQKGELNAETDNPD